MTSVIFLDTNIPIYASGLSHPLKRPCAFILQVVAGKPECFITDAEVFQELLHRYLALRRWPQGKEVFQELGRLMQGRVEHIIWEDIEQAAAFADAHPGVNARDLLHLAVMTRVGCTRVVSADGHFGSFPGIERLDPLELELWEPRL